MSAHPAWKKRETECARFWGTERTPLSGRNSRHGTHADTLHRSAYIELKHGAACPRTWAGIRNLFLDVEAKAAAEAKFPVLVLHPKNYNAAVEHWPAYLRVRLSLADPVPSLVGELVCVPQHLAKRLVEAATALLAPSVSASG